MSYTVYINTVYICLYVCVRVRANRYGHISMCACVPKRMYLYVYMHVRMHTRTYAKHILIHQSFTTEPHDSQFCVNIHAHTHIDIYLYTYR